MNLTDKAKNFLKLVSGKLTEQMSQGLLVNNNLTSPPGCKIRISIQVKDTATGKWVTKETYEPSRKKLWRNWMLNFTQGSLLTSREKEEFDKLKEQQITNNLTNKIQRKQKKLEKNRSRRITTREN